MSYRDGLRSFSKQADCKNTSAIMEGYGLGNTKLWEGQLNKDIAEIAVLEKSTGKGTLYIYLSAYALVTVYDGVLGLLTHTACRNDRGPLGTQNFSHARTTDVKQT